MQKTPTASEVQSAIGKVRGVMATRVVGENGDISEVHILAQAGRPAKQIVRDVESLVAAQFGLKLDHRKVSVAQIETPSEEKAPLPSPELRGVRIEVEGGRVKVHVTLAHGEKVYEGSAEGAGVSVNRYRLAAIAALSALENYLNNSCRLILDDLVPFHLGGWEGYLAGVVLVSTFGEEHLVGCSLVKKDKVDAVIKAACNAVDRRIRHLGGDWTSH